MDNARMTAYSTLHFEARQRAGGSKVRQPARAGQFYPGDAASMTRSIEDYLTAADQGQPAQTRRAIMLPHAGWQFCGKTIGMTLARTVVPDTVIIIGPRHTPYGPNWSVAPHMTWDIPGAAVPIAAELADQVTDAVDALQCEPDAHRMEHGAEVLIPFLHHRNRNVRVLPIVIGQASYESTEPLAAALAAICAQAKDKLLLVISSDMNHFAAEPENRRLDHLALDAMRTGDPRRLYDTGIQNDISMCGFIPACIIMQTLLKLSPDLTPELVHYTNSAETTGDASRVVGYAGVLLD